MDLMRLPVLTLALEHESPAASAAGEKTFSKMSVHCSSVQDLLPEKGMITNMSRWGFDAGEGGFFLDALVAMVVVG